MSTLSQITTALENDKSAIRQAILSGGGTCPEEHGFNDFASDIGTINTGLKETVFTNVTQPYSPTYNKIYYDDTMLIGVLRGGISYSLYGSGYITMFTIPHITSIPAIFYCSIVDINASNIYPITFYTESGQIKVAYRTYGSPTNYTIDTNGCSIRYERIGSTSYFSMYDAVIQVYAIF